MGVIADAFAAAFPDGIAVAKGDVRALGEVIEDFILDQGIQQLIDGPGNFTGHAGQPLIVNATEDGLDFG